MALQQDQITEIKRELDFALRKSDTQIEKYSQKFLFFAWISSYISFTVIFPLQKAHKV